MSEGPGPIPQDKIDKAADTLAGMLLMNRFKTPHLGEACSRALAVADPNEQRRHVDILNIHAKQNMRRANLRILTTWRRENPRKTAAAAAAAPAGRPQGGAV